MRGNVQSVPILTNNLDVFVSPVTSISKVTVNPHKHALPTNNSSVGSASAWEVTSEILLDIVGLYPIVQQTNNGGKITATVLRDTVKTSTTFASPSLNAHPMSILWMEHVNVSMGFIDSTTYAPRSHHVEPTWSGEVVRVFAGLGSSKSIPTSALLSLYVVPMR